MSKKILPTLVALIVLLSLALGNNTRLSVGLDDPYDRDYVQAVADTLPPIQERYETSSERTSSNPFDLQDPPAIDKKIEYDPVTGQYYIQEEIGENNFFRPPTYLTFDEYMELRRQQDEQSYFNELSGVGRGNGLSVDDPLAGIDVEKSLIDRLFGGTEVSIQPQGSIDLTFGVDYQRLDNPVLPERQRRTGGFDFDMDIQMNVTGKIGEKLNLTTNYNTGATFNFDRQVIKLDYNSDLFSEDDILKKVEAGNVSLPLRGSLIQGAQSLFGLKTELQFGNLRLTAIASQQQSQRENIQIEGGSQVQDFYVKADEYDENRHFFLSHYNRDVYEPALRNVPQINTLYQVEAIEVWITNDRNEVNNVRDIVAIADMAEPEAENMTNPTATGVLSTPRYREICDGLPLPDNGANPIFNRIVGREEARDIDRAVSVLQNQFGYQQVRDFEKVSARKLNEREFTFHPELGFVSLNVNVQPDQVVGVAYRYKYNGQIFRVGEMSVNTDDVSIDTTDLTPKVLFVKMLKSTSQRPGLPTWDLMMKNVYNIGAYQVTPEDFRFDVVYEDPGRGVKRFLPSGPREGEPLIRLYNLDRLNTYNDPQPDGLFDFVPGLTINPTTGRIYFPVLEPFGDFLAEQVGANSEFLYPELYDSTRFVAQNFPEKNRYALRGSFKSSISNEISLGAFNIPPNSVRVTTSGQQLIEGRDYEVDYSSGRVRILNDALLASGAPINVSFEDNTLFGFQSKTMIGLRADYEVSPDINIGATFLQLFERPFTPKVNIGDDPINNRIFGMDLTFNKEAPWLTRAVDKLPFYSTSQPSSISFTAEGAYLDPGHARAINIKRKDKGGTVYVDDFEGSSSTIDLRSAPNRWFLASVPQNDAENNNPLFPEAREDGLVTGANRAKLNWYRIDPSARSGTDGSDPYTSRVDQREVFPNADIPPNQRTIFQTFDLSYSPRERGPYNFDLPEGYPGFTRGLSVIGNDSLILNDPQTRWGGIMTELITNDFQTSNIEFLEFWMLSPFHDTTSAALPAPDAEERQGNLYINLGTISEDILKDSRKFFENGLPSDGNVDRPTETTVWSRVPVGQQITRGFDNTNTESRSDQDTGLDGFDDAGERVQFSPWLNAVTSFNPSAAARASLDVSNDNFRYYNDNSFGSADGIRTRYRFFNNPQGNSRANTGGSLRSSGTNIPDAEDINRDNTLNEAEAYYQYAIPLRVDPSDRRRIDLERTPYITDVRDDTESDRIWYRFRIPLREFDAAVGGIQDFRSIRFMRMYMQGFQNPTILRFASLELVRNQWRRLDRNDIVNSGGIGDPSNDVFSIDAVNIEENSSRQPFNYTLPPDIVRERSVGVFNNLQNEQSLAMRVDGLDQDEFQAVFKYTDVDLRLYERLQMFVHAEKREQEIGDISDIPDGALSVFMRLGSDFTDNYYEYEVPLSMSDVDNLTGNRLSEAYKLEVWKRANEFDFPLEILRDLKQRRNESDIPPGGLFEDSYVSDQGGNHKIRVKGNPNLGYTRLIMIGVKNTSGIANTTYGTEVWVNELRAYGLDERGGAAAIGRLDMQLADLGSITLAGNISTVGFGALDNSVHERSREQIAGYDVAASVEMGKFLPEGTGLRVPLYLQHSRVTETPEYDPYDLDIKLQDKLNRADNAADRDSLREQAQDRTRISSINLTNVRKERTGAGKPKPWDISNFSVSYSHTRTIHSDPLISNQNQRRTTGGLNYTYSRGIKYIEPFKGIKSKALRIIKEININPIPNSFSFSTLLDRQFGTTSYRFAEVAPRFNTFYNKRFMWDRDYDLQWDLTKALKINFNASANSVIDEPDESVLREDPRNLSESEIRQIRKDSIWQNIQDLGRPKLYQHNLNVTYTLPLRYLPFLDFMQVRASYQAGYSWNAGSLNVADTLGNIIQNSQKRQLTADLNFEKFYDNFPLLKSINRPKRTRRGAQPRNNRSRRGTDSKDDDKKDKEPSKAVKALIRPLLLIRKARFSYSEDFQTVIPGYTPTSNLLGMSPNFESPGWDFVAGIQPRIRELSDFDRTALADGRTPNSKDFLYNLSQNGFFTNNVFFNQDVLQTYTQNYDGLLTLEPINDFRIDLELSRTFTEDYSETFKRIDKDDPNSFVHAVPTYGGSMTVSYSALSTLFENDEGIKELFDQFEENRVDISQRLGTGAHSDPILAAAGYTEGFGPNQQDVLIPAFIAAYTGQSTADVGLDIFDVAPKVNWRGTYDGLGKLPGFRDLFANFSISHGYRSSLTVNRYRTGLDYLATLQDDNTVDPLDTVSFNFFPRLEIPDVVIQEGFAPMISIEAQTQNGMSFNIDYQRQRSLNLSLISKSLSETKTKEIVLGFGYILQGVNIGFLTGKRNGRGRNQADEEAPDDPNAPGSNRRNNNRRGTLQTQDLDIQFNFSLRDDITIVHKLDQDINEPTRGTYAISISPSVEYQLNKQLSLRAFVDYRQTRPKTSLAFPRTDVAGGVVVRFQLN